MKEESAGGPLAPYRVLDLTDEKGLLCGRILGDLGADTLVVEPIQGNSARRIGSFLGEEARLSRSLFWFALNTNKRSITLNIETADGRELFKRLVKTADFVVESFAPGYLAGLGLGYEDLAEINPAIVVTSITPFGQTGPYRDYPATDLTLMAIGGLTYLSGEPDREPLRVPVPQAYFHVGAWAAAGSMVAFHHRQATGDGQHVDVSMQQSCVWATFVTPEWWSYAGTNVERQGTWRQIGNVRMRAIYPAKDGHVIFTVLGGAGASMGQWKLVEWLDRERLCPDWLRGYDWSKLDVATAEQAFFDSLAAALSPLFLRHTVSELFEWSMRNELSLAPVSDVQQLLESPQLQYRAFWRPVDYPELHTSIIHPGPLAKLTETPIDIRRRAPYLGEHNLEVFRDELRLSPKQLASLTAARVI